MTKFKAIHLIYILLIIIAFSAGKTPIGIPPDSLIGSIIKIVSVLLMILFFATFEMISKKDEKFLEKYSKVVKVVFLPYMILSMWAILEIKYKLIGFSPNGSFYNM